MAQKKYDVEMFLDNFKTIFLANLNNKITQINTEKSTVNPSDFSIPTISNDAWFLNHIPQVWNYPQFIVWGLGGVQLTSQQSDAAIQTVNVFIEVCVPDRGEQLKESTIYQLLRYSRSLQEVAIENHAKLRGYSQLQLDSLSPGLVDISGKMLRMAGINLTASFDV